MKLTSEQMHQLAMIASDLWDEIPSGKGYPCSFCRRLGWHVCADIELPPEFLRIVACEYCQMYKNTPWFSEHAAISHVMQLLEEKHGEGVLTPILL